MTKKTWRVGIYGFQISNSKPTRLWLVSNVSCEASALQFITIHSLNHLFLSFTSCYSSQY